VNRRMDEGKEAEMKTLILIGVAVLILIAVLFVLGACRAAGMRINRLNRRLPVSGQSKMSFKQFKQRVIRLKQLHIYIRE